MTIAEQSFFIGGRWTPSKSGATYQSVNPYTGDVATRAAAATVADVHRAVEARAPELSAAITAEMDGPTGWGAYNVKVLCEKLHFAAGSAYQGLTGEAMVAL